MTHTEIGQDLLNRFAEACSEIAIVNKNPKLDGRFMTMFLSPKAPAK
jgi:translation initiation factor IF-3